MPNSVDLVTAAWRSILGSSAPSSSMAAAAADLAAGRHILEKIQFALAHALHLRGGRAHALTTDEIAPIKALCDDLLPAHCASLLLLTAVLWCPTSLTVCCFSLCVGRA